MNQYSHAIHIDHNLAPGPLWEYKHTAKELSELETVDAYNYSAQYLQDPHKKGGSIFQTEWWEYYDVLPDYAWKAIFGDTALKDGEHNDWTVFQCWGYWQGKIYLIDQYRKRIKAVDLEDVLIDFWNKHKGSSAQPNRGCYIEDKASGIELIQRIQRRGGIPIIPIPRNKGQSMPERGTNFSPWIKSGLLYLPRNTDWIYDYKNEFERFSHLMTHKHDDQVSVTLDAIEHMLIEGPQLKKDDSGNNGKNKALAPSKNSRVW